ncbi:hypothetical protein RchiOBHm_Chr1g0384671 [Rosa chinensis]|uniref:Uncharacterized protein n=1 Tax=Rosa chinensis TaxID=74649 RepID=A0A2P6SPY1_ROSCH|nr:hypothetical protein RchiOBHm_Chr1g0384671 [Rosa chinensis]
MEAGLDSSKAVEHSVGVSVAGRAPVDRQRNQIPCLFELSLSSVVYQIPCLFEAFSLICCFSLLNEFDEPRA